MSLDRLRPGQPPLRIAEFASLIGYHRDTVRKWIDAGLLATFQTSLPSAERRITVEEGRRFIEKMNLEPEKSADSADSEDNPLDGAVVEAQCDGDMAQRFAKVDEDQRLVFGLASVSVSADGQLVEDLQGDVIQPEELEKAQYDYVVESRVGGTMHETEGTATLVESVVITPEKLPLILKAIGLDVDAKGNVNISKFKGVASWVGYKVLDAETWKAVKSGELGAFSIGGEAVREAA